MVFNGDANSQDLCTLANKMVKSDNTQYPLVEKAADANWGMRKIWAAIFSAYGGWIMDDSNASDLPEATGDLTTSQFYALPDNASLYGVEWMDSSGFWHPLDPITLEDIESRGVAESQFLPTAANPRYFRPLANGFKVYPAADTARTAAIRIQINRDIVPFTAGTTNTEPGFDRLFHESVALFMALQYAKINSLAVAGGVMRGGFKTGLLADWSEALADITRHYSSKYRRMFPPRFKKGRAAARQYI